MEAVNLDATLRDPSARKHDARKARAEGRLPGVIYGRSYEATPVAVDPAVFDAIFRKSQDKNTLLHLKVGGASVPCLVKTVQRHPASREILHVDFYALDKDQKVVVEVPIDAQGRPRGATLGGKLRLIKRTVPVRVPYDRIPKAIVVDVTPLEIDDLVRVSELRPPEGEVVFDHDYNVLTIAGKRAVLEVPEAAPAEVAEGEEAETEGGEEAEESE